MYGAIARNDVSAVRELIARAPAVLHAEVVGRGWLHLAAQAGQIEIMDALVTAGLPIDQLTGDGVYTALKKAAGQGQYLACKWLLNLGADVNHGVGTLPTPIFGAIYGKSLALVQLFVERGADLEATFGNPRIDVLNYANRHGTAEIVEFLQQAIRQG
jgi:ankyrin repeat protein